MAWLELLKWLDQQDNATTVAELQQQINMIIKISRQDVWFNCIMWIVLAVIVLAVAWYAAAIDKKLKKLEARVTAITGQL